MGEETTLNITPDAKPERSSSYCVVRWANAGIDTWSYSALGQDRSVEACVCTGSIQLVCGGMTLEAAEKEAAQRNAAQQSQTPESATGSERAGKD